MNRKDTKEQEMRFLAGEYKKSPELFGRQTQFNDLPFLETIGIFLPPKIQHNLFPGYLSLWPQDFIVEEISRDGVVHTIDSQNDTMDIGSPESPTIYATLIKCGLSTVEAIEEMHAIWGIDRKNIQYAGIKDKNAITSQAISFRGTSLEKITSGSSPYLFLKNTHFGKGVVEIGGLQGNRFTILVRTDEHFNKEKFLENLETVKKEGFYNFYYSQRFGSPRFINWFWALQIFKGEYEKAVMSFLCSEGLREIPYFKKVRAQIKEHFGNWQKISNILTPFPIVLQNETKVVDHLKNHPTDFIGALQQIPKQVELWIFAYSSLLFNRKISAYIRNGEPVPEKLPLILGKDQKDWVVYDEFLKEDGISSIPFKNITRVSSTQWTQRDLATKESAMIYAVKIVPEGVILSFDLPKGCYATTFFSHLFQLAVGLPPKNISTKAIDTKEALGQKNIKDTLERFKEITFDKTENFFDKFE